MIEHEIFRTVERARKRLTALHAQLAQQQAAEMSADILSGLADLQASMQKVQARYGLLLQVLDSTTDLICAKDRDGHYTMINSRGAELFDRSVAEVLGSDDRDLRAAGDAERVMALDREVIESGAPRTTEESLEVDGVHRTLITTTTPLFDAQQDIRGVISVAQDVTAHKRRERDASRHAVRLRALATMAVIDEERLRHSLAADLHDGLGQEIALIKLKLSSLKASASAGLQDSLIGIMQLVDEAHRTLSSITYRVSPASLHHLGLLPAVQWLGEDVFRRHGMSVRIVDEDSTEVTDQGIRVILFRAVRELLVNAATHAYVDEVVVRLEDQGDAIRITVEDLGAGFDTGDLDQHGYGLFGIRQQCEHIQGSMEIESTPGSGTKVTLTVPVRGVAAIWPSSRA